ncbi:PAS domain-containing sensor histidine kinase [Jatrophihabitans fulvus]
MSRAERTNFPGADALAEPTDASAPAAEAPSAARMITDLAHALNDDDCRASMRKAVEIIAPALCAGAVLVLADPPGYEGQVLSATSADTVAALQMDASLRLALAAIRDGQRPGDEPSALTDRRLRDALVPPAGQQAIVAAVHGDDGLVGALACCRDSDSDGFADTDEGVLGASAGVIDLLLTISRQRYEQERLARRWQEAFDSAPVGMGFLDAAGHIALVNPRGEEIFGRSASSLAGLNWRELTHPDDVDTEERHLAEVLEQRAPRMVHTKRVMRPDGEARWVQASTVIRAAAADEPAEYFTQLLDITDLRAAENEAHHFAALVEGTANFVCLADLDGRLTYLNPAGRRLVGLTDDADVTAFQWSDFLTSGAADVPALARLRVDGHAREMLELRCRGGSPARTVDATALVLTEPGTGTPMGLAAILRDITDEVEARRALERVSEQRRQLLQEVVTAEENERGRLAEVLHDEPMQLVAAIGLRLRALAGTHDPADEVRTIIDLADRTGQSLRAVLSGLDVGPADESFTSMIAEAAPRLCPGVEVTVTGEPGPLPHTVALVLARAVREALNNAGRHAHASTVAVTFARDPGGLDVRVTDDGVGMGRVPERRGHLGLRTLTARIEALGGRCTAGDADGGGSLVHLWLPAEVLAGA